MMQKSDDTRRTEFNYGKSIFPILSGEIEDKGEAHKLKFLGTGFFTIIEGWPLIVTAGHVLSGLEGHDASLYLATRYGAHQTLALRGGVVVHNKLDIAFFVIDPSYYKEHQAEFVPIPVMHETLSVGTDVFTLGFPNSQVIIDAAVNTPIIEIDQFFFKGYVSNILDTTGRGGTSKSYLVKFPAMNGISGAPLLIMRQEGVACVGFMFQEKSFSQMVDRKEVEIQGEKVTIPVYQTYNFGVACDSEPLVKFRDLLAGFAEKRRQRA